MKEQVKELREKGWSIRKIAKTCNISAWKCGEYLKELGLNGLDKCIRIRKYPVNHSLFSKIDTQEKAYFLGFLYADGHVNPINNSVNIGLQASDSELLEQIRKVFNIQNPLCKFKGRYSINHPYTEKVSLSLYSKQIVSDLCNIGCVPRKSDVLVFPTIIPHKLIRHFIRGYFDGDGSVYSRHKQVGLTANFMSTYEFCKSVLELIPCNQILKIRKEKRSLKNVWQFEISSKADINNLYDFMYKDATIFLERKYKRFKDYLNREPK